MVGQMLALLASGFAIVLAGATFFMLTRVLREREGFWRDVLGTCTRLFLSCAIGTALVALTTVLWLAPAERHRVKITATDDADAPLCTFTWPSDTADAQQSALCPGSHSMRGDHETAIRLPGTGEVTLAHGPVDPFTWVTLWGIGFFTFGALIGGGLNARPDKRRREAQNRRLSRAWAEGRVQLTNPAGARQIWSGRDDLEWPQIAAASEAPGKTGGPLDDPHRIVVSPPEPPVLQLGYPLPYLRVVTRPAEAPHRSVMLFFVEEGAWWAVVDGQPARTGHAVITRNPEQPDDLAVVIGTYTVDVGDTVMFFDTAALEALRRVASRWVST